MEKFTTVNGTAFRYLDAGIGKDTILLLHGDMESLDIWEDLVSVLGKEFRCVALDLPGHGVSDVKGEVHTMEFLAETVSGLLKQIGVEKCVAVGHSMGGYAALALADLHPEQLAGLVLFHSRPTPDAPEKKINREREIEIVRSGRKETLSVTLPGKGFAAVNRDRFREQIEDLALQVMLTEDEGIVALLNGMKERPDRNEVIDRLKVPVLFIFGKQDEYIPVAAAEETVARHPKAEVVWLENSGHMGFIEEKAKSEEVLSAFVRRCFR